MSDNPVTDTIVTDDNLTIPPNLDPEFPKAIEPSEWYAYPPIEAGAPKPFNETRLGKLAIELRLMILSFVGFGEGHEMVVHSVRSFAPDQERYDDFYLLDRFIGPLAACRQFRKDALAHLENSSTTHVVHHSKNILTLRHDLGLSNLTWVRSLKLHAQEAMIVKHEGIFPDVMDVLCSQLPSLIRFQLVSFYLPSWKPVEERTRDAQITRAQQEVRFLLRFGAFLVLHHANIDLMIWPADSLVPEDSGFGEPVFTPYIDLMSNSLHAKRRRFPAVAEKTTMYKGNTQCKDRTLDATALRRLKWAELANVNIEDFVIASDSLTSNVEEEHNHFWKVDVEGYMTRAERLTAGKKFIPADGLIGLGRNNMRLAEVEKNIENAGQTARSEKGKGRGRGRSRKPAN